MGSLLIVMPTPGRDDASRLVQACEPVLVETLISKLAVKTLNVGILRRLSSLYQKGRHATLIGPLIESPGGKLRALVSTDRLRMATELSDTIQKLCHIITGQTVCRLDQHGLFGGVVHDCQDLEASAVGE